MQLFSVVIITKNEAARLPACLQALLPLQAEIIVMDSGSTDDTCALATKYGASVYQSEWLGYAATKNKANALASHDWILSLDADEVVDPVLCKAILACIQTDLSVHQAFYIRRVMKYADHTLRHGSVRNEYRLRLFNRTQVQWNDQSVHENLFSTEPLQTKKLPGWVWHYSYTSSTQHRDKLDHYAQLSATQMYANGKQATFIKRFLNPVFHLIKNYIFLGGFLDGLAGWQFARNEMYYVYSKYKRLAALRQKNV